MGRMHSSPKGPPTLWYSRQAPSNCASLATLGRPVLKHARMGHPLASAGTSLSAASPSASVPGQYHDSQAHQHTSPKMRIGLAPQPGGQTSSAPIWNCILKSSSSRSTYCSTTSQQAKFAATWDSKDQVPGVAVSMEALDGCRCLCKFMSYLQKFTHRLSEVASECE